MIDQMHTIKNRQLSLAILMQSKWFALRSSFVCLFVCLFMPLHGLCLRQSSGELSSERTKRCLEENEKPVKLTWQVSFSLHAMAMLVCRCFFAKFFPPLVATSQQNARCDRTVSHGISKRQKFARCRGRWMRANLFYLQSTETQAAPRTVAIVINSCIRIASQVT